MKKFFKRKKGERLIFKDGKVTSLDNLNKEDIDVKNKKSTSNETGEEINNELDKEPKNINHFKIKKILLGIFLIAFLFIIISIGQSYIKSTRNFLKNDSKIDTKEIKDIKDDKDTKETEAIRKDKDINAIDNIIQKGLNFTKDKDDKSSESKTNLNYITYVINTSNKLKEITTAIRNQTSNYISNQTTNITVNSSLNSYKDRLSQIKSDLDDKTSNAPIEAKKLMNILNDRLNNISAFIDNASSNLNDKNSLINICNKHIDLENKLADNQTEELIDLCKKDNISYSLDENKNITVGKN